MKVKQLTPRQERFVEEYMIDSNATQAAIRAGYAVKGAEVTGCKLLRVPKVQALVDQKRTALAKRTEVSAERVIAEYCKIAFADMKDYVTIETATGNVRLDFSKIPMGGTAAIAEITQEEFTDGVGQEAREVKRTKFKLYDKLRALDALAKHLGLFVDRSEEELTGEIIIRVIREAPPPLVDVRSKVVVNHAEARQNGHVNGNGKVKNLPR